jgi:hypothetical protein
VLGDRLSLLDINNIPQLYIAIFVMSLKTFVSGDDFLISWIEIAKCQFKKSGGLHYCKKDGINYFVIPHPMAHGINNADWVRMAAEIKALSKMK